MLKLSVKNGKPNHGFTIVELLIVVVIIAILATISIVAYNGITARAKQSSADSSAKQVATKIMSYEVENGSFPSALTDIGITNTGDTSYQYSFNNTVNPKTWCATVTVGDKSSFTSNTQASAKSGGCPGHGQGGQEAITNIATNPSFESNITGATGYFAPPLSQDTTTSAYGSASLKTTTNSTTNFQGIIVFVSDSVTPGDKYTCSFSIKGTNGYAMKASGRAYNVGTMLSEGLDSKDFTLSSNWQRPVITFVLPANTTRFAVQARLVSPASGVVMNMDGIMCVKGSADYGYADGNSPNWVWNGAPNNSTSTGPAL